MPPIQESDKQVARELLIKSKIYRVFAVAFALMGVGVFVAIYAIGYHADPVAALHDPMAVVYVIFPFLPAIVLSRKASKAEKQLVKMAGNKAEAKKQSK